MDKLEYIFDPFEIAGVKKPKSKEQRDEILELVSEYVLDEVKTKVAERKSPVKGYGPFDDLEPEYAKWKKSEVGTDEPDLSLYGDMLDALNVEPVRGGKLTLKIDDESQVPKADGHNNFSGKSRIPTRRFIPNEDEGDEFRTDIQNGIKRIVRDALSDPDAVLDEMEEMAKVKVTIKGALKDMIREGKVQVMDRSQAEAMAKAVITEMKAMVSRGRSPIDGVGRFDDYKGVRVGKAIHGQAKDQSNAAKKLSAQAKSFRAQAKSATRVARIMEAKGKKRGIRSARVNARSLHAKARSLKEQAFLVRKGVKDIKESAGEQIQKFYPFTVMDEYPDKKVRPVNLHLSGDMLSNLTFDLTEKKSGWSVKVGFLDDLSAKKESGHREGVNGQPKRPIIPQGEEVFHKTITNMIRRHFADALSKFTKGKK